MALFLPFYGSAIDMSTIALSEGKIYFNIADSKIYFDALNENSILTRYTLNAETADVAKALIGGIPTTPVNGELYWDTTDDTLVYYNNNTAYELAYITSLGDLNITATAAELNILDGATITTAELNYLGGTTGNIQAQLDLKAPLNSPALEGTPTAPTAAMGTNTTQIATTEFVQSALDGFNTSYITTIGDGVSTSYTINHELNTTDIIVQGYSNNKNVWVEFEIIDVNTIIVNTVNAIATDAWKIIVLNAHSLTGDVNLPASITLNDYESLTPEADAYYFIEG